jgi:hypothetical protein
LTIGLSSGATGRGACSPSTMKYFGVGGLAQM